MTVSEAVSVYDGKPLKSDVYEITSGSLAAGDDIVATFDGEITDVGTLPNTPSIEVLGSGGEVVTSNYDITTVVGDLKVEKRPLYIAPAAAEKVYDGEPLEQKE